MTFSALLVGAALVIVGVQGRAQGINLDTTAIEEATGVKGQLIPEESVFRRDGRHRRV